MQAQGVMTKVYQVGTPSLKRRSDGGNWPYPFGLRLFRRIALLLVVSDALASISSSRLALRQNSWQRDLGMVLY